MTTLDDQLSAWANANKRYTSYRFAKEIRDELRAINKPDNWHCVWALVKDALWIASCILVCVNLSFWFYPLAVVFIGARQRGMSTILHDCAHGVGIANRKLQLVVGTVFTAYPIFQQHYAYKLSHVLTHHPQLGNPNKDPDLRFFIEQGAYKSSRRRVYVRRAVIMPLIGSQTWGYLRYLIRNRYKHVKTIGRGTPGDANDITHKRVFDRIAFWAFWAIVVGLCAATGNIWNLVLFWFIPYLTSFQILGWYIELSEHTPLVRDASIDLYMTRNRKSKWWERSLTGIHHDHYHLEHHLDPRTPFYQLPKAREIRLQDPNYAAVDAQFGGLFHKGPSGQASAMTAIIDAMAIEDR